MNWVDKLLEVMEASAGNTITVKVGGETVEAMIKQELIDFVLRYKLVLFRMGKQTFLDFLGLVNQGKNDEAFHLMLQSMTAEDIIAQMQMDTAELKRWNDAREKFMDALKQFVLYTLAPQAVKVLIGLLIV